MACCSPSRIPKKKITQLPAATEAALTDLLVTVQYDQQSGEYTNVKQTLQVIADLILESIGEVGTATPNLDGSGSPEGIVTAAKNIWYRDNDVDAYYWKTVDGGNTGWTQVV